MDNLITAALSRSATATASQPSTVKASGSFKDLMAGYIINPVSNLRLFTNVTFRNYNPETNTASAINTNTSWFNIGVRTDLFNWYNDF